MYPAAIAESWFQFIAANKQELLGSVSDPESLGKEFIELLDRICIRIASVGVGTPIEERVQGALNSMENHLARISKKFALKLAVINKLKSSLEGPLRTTLVNGQSKSTGLFGFFWSSPPNRKAPIYGRELLLLSETIDKKNWINVMVNVCQPMLIVLETARMLGEADFDLFRKVYVDRLKRFVHQVQSKVDRAIKISNSHRLLIYRKEIPLVMERSNSRPVEATRNNIEKGQTSTAEDNIILQNLQFRVDFLQKKRKTPLFGSASISCEAKKLFLFIDSLVATSDVMDAYMVFLARQMDSKRRSPPFIALPSTLMDCIDNRSNKAKTIFHNSGLQKLTQKMHVLLPVTVGDIWVLFVIELSHQDPCRLMIFSPVITKREEIEKLAKIIIDTISSHFEESIIGELGLQWEKIDWADLPFQSDCPLRSSGFVVALARAVALSRSIEGIRNHKIGVLVAALRIT